MRRNMLGLKYVGIAFCIIISLITAGNKYIQGATLSVSDCLVFAICGVMLAVWIFIVKVPWVQVPAEAYARRLLENCDRTG